jgi:peptidyl-prolyl cis-trans isomerase SurA
VFLNTLAPNYGRAETLVDRLVAEVNGEGVTYSEVMDKVKNGPLVVVSSAPAPTGASPFETALQDLINFRLILQKAQELEIDVSDEKLDEEIAGFLEKRKLTIEGLKDALKEQGMTFANYRQDFRNQAILNQFQGRVIYPAIKLTDRDVEAYYLKTSGNSNDSLRLTLRQLFIEVRQDAGEVVKKGKEALAQKAFQELSSGLSFEQAVKVYSDAEDARANGGLMPPLFLKDLAASFQKVIQNLEEGQFSTPIKTPNGYFLFFLEKKSFAGSDEFQKQKRELEMKLRQEEVEHQTAKWLEDERRKSKVRIVEDRVSEAKATTSKSEPPTPKLNPTLSPSTQEPSSEPQAVTPKPSAIPASSQTPADRP